MDKLPSGWFDRHAVPVARELLGKLLVRSTPEGMLIGRVVETEAYTGRSDPGSHAYHRETVRNRVMFGPAGFVYVYFTYGMHWCMNIVTDPPGVPGAVLIRALEPLHGVDSMEVRRGGRPLRQLCNGPAKLCQAFGIDGAYNGANLQTSDLWMADDGFQNDRVGVSARVGITAGRELPYRFFLVESPWVSPGRPSAAIEDVQ